MIRETIQHHIDEGNTNIPELAYVLSVCKQTVYNRLSDKGNFTENEIRSLIITHPSEAVRASTLREITNNNAVLAQPSSQDEIDLDINGDGEVNLGDAMFAAMKYQKAAHNTLQLIFEAFQRDPNSITVEQLEALIANNEASVAYTQVLDRICSREIPRRRKCKPIQIAG